MSNKSKSTKDSVVSRNSQITRYCAAGAIGLAGTVTTTDASIVFINYNDAFLPDTAPNDATSTFYPIDINQDGIVDFRLRTRNDAAGSSFVTAGIRPNGTGGTIDVVGTLTAGSSGNLIYPSRLQAGATIGPAATFQTLTAAGFPSSNGFFTQGSGYAGMQWVDATQSDGYLGLRFTAGGNTFYAYASLSIIGFADPNNPDAFILHSIAYDNTPNTPIVAGAVPEANSLGLVALGGIGLAAYRQRRRAASAKSA